ncbi:MAG TPA: hypothetical protein PLY93_03885 [Turneriella sp.]|nr:hypothetical protein [Turneriella sp.]
MNRIPPLSLFKSISFIAALVFIVIACSHAVIGKSTPSETSALPLITADGTCTGTNPTIKKCTVSFYIQPYKGAKILNDTETLPIKFSQIDKTMALATVWINDVPSDEEKRALKVLQPSNDGVRGLDVLWRETPVVDFPLVALDAPTQKHRFVRRILTGKQPRVRCSFLKLKLYCRF